MGEQKPRYAGIKVRRQCSHCGQPVPIIGPPREETECPHCLDTFDTRDMWQSLLRDFENDIGYQRGKTQKFVGLGSGSTGEMRFALPACGECGEMIPKPMLKASAAETFHCPSCGAACGTAPIPEWLRKKVPSAAQFYRSGAWAGHEGHAAELQDDVKPVSMNCPECDAGLKATAASKRIMSCQYCSAEVYLPDAVWRRLHPVQKVKEWFVRFEGITDKERNRRFEQKKQQEQRALDQKAEQYWEERREKRKQDRISKAGSQVKLAWLVTLIASALMLCTAAAWLADAVSIPLLIVLAAAQLPALWLVARPALTVTDYDGEWAMFTIRIWPVMAFVPIAGLAFAAWKGIRLSIGRIEGFSIQTTNKPTKSYDDVELSHGEGRPAAFMMLCNAISGHLMFAILVAPALRSDIGAAVPWLVDLGRSIGGIFG